MENTTKALGEKLVGIKKEMRSVHEQLTATPSDELQSKWDELVARCEELEVSHARAARIESLTDADPIGNGALPPTATNPEPEDRSKDNPFNRMGEYSVLRAVRCRLDGKLDGLEGEISEEIAQRSGKSPQGFYVPFSLPIGPLSGAEQRSWAQAERRDLTTSDASGMVPTIKSNTFIDALRARMVMSRVGSQVLTGMSGNFDIPKVTTDATAYWVAEGTAITASTPVVGQVAFSPSTCGAYVDVTRKLVLQSSQDAENFARNLLNRNVAVELDRVGLNGSGSGAEPEGILQKSVGDVDHGPNGGAPSWATTVQYETEVAQDNADSDTMAFITTPACRGKMKTVEKASGTAQFLWAFDEVNGYPAYATSQLPSNLTKGTGTALSAAVFGDFSQAVYAFWSGLDVMVDPYTNATSGTIRIVTLVDTDFQVRHDEAFSASDEIVTT